MAFGEFKSMGDVQLRYSIRYQAEAFVDAQPVTPSPHFQEEFEFNRKNLPILSSKGSRCETVIFPILREVYKPFAGNFVLWVQQPLASDAVPICRNCSARFGLFSRRGVEKCSKPLQHKNNEAGEW